MLACALATGCAAPVATPGPTTVPVRSPRVAAYETYLAAWSTLPLYPRLRLLQTSLAEDVVFTGPRRTRTGLDDLAEQQRGFQKQNPGDSFELVGMRTWDNHAIATWRRVDAERRLLAEGHDALVFDERDHIKSILVFEGAPVSLTP